MKPEVSIILPYFEGQRWLRRAIHSVQTQEKVSWELIVVDDGSVNTAEAIINETDDSRIKYIYIDHCGKGGALNRGIQVADSDIICFLDQDDIMLPQRLATQIRVFKKNKLVDGVYSDYERRHENGDFIDQVYSSQASPMESIHRMAAGRNSVTMQTLMLKKSVYENLEGFSNDPAITGLDDLEFFVRLFLSGAHLVYEPGVVQCWLKHNQNFSQSDAFQEARLHLLNRLSELAYQHPILNSELKHFRFHTFGMRGLHYLETGRSEIAAIDLCRALSCKPYSVNTYYLFLKSIIISCGKHFKSYLLQCNGRS